MSNNYNLRTEHDALAAASREIDLLKAALADANRVKGEQTEAIGAVSCALKQEKRKADLLRLKMAFQEQTARSALQMRDRSWFERVFNRNRSSVADQAGSVKSIRDLIVASGLFDESYYLKENPDVAKAGVDALEHYISHGRFEGREPSENFNSEAYLKANPDLDPSTVSPILHYIQHGKQEGRSLGLEEANEHAALRDLITTSGLFDESYYLRENPEVAAAGMNALEHYVLYGRFEGRTPSAKFNPQNYLDVNSDLDPKMVSPILHYIKYGKQEGRLLSRDTPRQIITHPSLERNWPWQGAQTVPPRMPNGNAWPRITIVTPSYNQGAFIEQTIRSVLLQGYPNLQYIVVDGGSSDDTATILKRYADQLDVCISEGDKGQAEAINKGFQHANGTILAWLNSDDMHMPDTLTSVATAFDALWNTGLPHLPDLVCGQVLILDDIAGKITFTHQNKFGEGIHLLSEEINDFQGVWQKPPGYFYQQEVFFTQSIWQKVGSSLNSLLHYALDYDLWIRMAKHKPYLLTIPKPLGIFRVHAQQKTKFAFGTHYPEHEAVSIFHRANSSPDAQYIPASIPFNIYDTIPAGKFQNRPLAYHATDLGNFYVPCLALNDSTGHAIRSGRIFEPDVIETARKHVKPGSVVLDVGTNYGQTSILFSNMVGDEGMVFSFEAQEYYHAILLKNIGANKKENIRAIHAAVFDRSRNEVAISDTFESLTINESIPVSSKVSEGVSSQVKTLAIDDMCIESAISFFKVDAQGRELFVLRGARDTILNHRMPVLFKCEEHLLNECGTKFEDCLEYIHSIGYRIENIFDGTKYLIVPDEKTA